jgi:ABC-type multidrug transport system fused ATPase/permease subunit
VGYDSTERRDSASDSESDQNSDEISAGKRRREQEHKEHLAGSGSWVKYAKEYRILLPHVLPERSRALMIQAFGVVACLIVSRLLAICIPRQAAIVVDALYERNSADPRSAFVVFLSLQFLSSTAIPFVEKWFLTPLQSGFNQRIARAVYSHMMHLSAEFHDAQSLSDRLNAVNGGDALFQLIQQIFFHALPKSADLAVAAVYLSRTFGPYEVLITATTGLAFLTVANYLTGLSRLSMKDRQEKRLEEGSVRADGLRSWHTAAAFNRIPYECNRHDVAVAARHRAENRSDMQSNIFGSLQSTTLFLGFVASGFLAVSQIQSKAISPAQYVMLGTYWSQLSGALQFFAGVWKRISHLFVETELLLSFMRAEAKVRDKPSAKPLRFSKGTIEFDSVSFSYDGKRNILKSIDLVIPGGQKVAFVGPSGAGKSTMMRLLMRMYDLMQGAIRIDGQDLRDVTLSSLRQVMGVVPQRAEFFDGTVREHVGYGREKASDEEIKSACGAASIPLEKFTKGYDTNVNTLSGGEQQRVAIARAILKEANIILLDEATSSVDTETEYDIQQSLNALCTGRTTIVIAHRLSTVKNADKIVVFEDGGIIESGNHEELIKRCGKYASLWENQFYHEPQNDNQS